MQDNQPVVVPKGHPKGLYVLFFTEMWERFSYYGMRAIFSLYMLKALMFNKEAAGEIYGSYTGLVYLTPLLGGYVADRYWGNRKSIIWGGIMMAIGQFFMFASASVYEQVDLSITLMWVGLFALIFGNGFFKPNISSMVGSLYPEGDPRIDSAFTIFYMGINLGALFAPIVTGGLGDTGNPADFKWGFFAAAIGMIIGTIVFVIYKNKYIVTDDGAPIGMPPKYYKQDSNLANEDTQSDSADETEAKKFSTNQVIGWTVFEVALFAVFWYFSGDWVGALINSLIIVAPAMILMDPSLSKVERDRLIAVFVLAAFVIFFWASFEQAGVSLTYFADEQTDRSLFGFEIPASWFQSVNAAFIVIFAPVFVALWGFLRKKGVEPNTPLKMSIGLVLLGLGYLIIAFGVQDIDPNVKVSMIWLITMYLLHTFGELAISPIGLSMVNKLSPLRLASLMMGVWFLSISLANKFAGTLSGFYPETDENGVLIAKDFLGYEITNLNEFFMLFVFLSIGSGVILFLVHKYLLKLMHGKQ